MSRPIRIFINGFGRIGRTVLRQLLEPAHKDRFELVGINDIAPLDTCAYLMRYDSVYGRFPQTLEVGDKEITIDGQRIPFACELDLRVLDLSNVDVVLECTGRVNNRQFAEAGIDAGAESVLISGPSTVADTTIVLGANEADLGDARIVSNASCTTNAIAPLLRVLDQRLGITSAHITTIHCYTGSQPTVDQPGASLARSRAAAVSMVPTTTSAANQITNVLPEFAGRLSVAAVRVPCISVSAVDAVLQISKDVSAAPRDTLREMFAGSPLIGMTDDPCVSTDLRARPESLVLALPETQGIGPNQLRVFGWYDNEWGFSARMLDMAQRLAARAT